MSDAIDPTTVTTHALSSTEIAMLKAASMEKNGMIPFKLCATDEGRAAIGPLIEKNLVYLTPYGTKIRDEGRLAVGGPSEREVDLCDYMNMLYNIDVAQDRLAAEAKQKRIDRIERLGIDEVERLEQFDRDVVAPIPGVFWREGKGPIHIVSLFVKIREQAKSTRASLDGSAETTFNLPNKYWTHPISRGDFICAVVPRHIADWVRSSQGKDIEFRSHDPEIIPAGLDAKSEDLWRIIRRNAVYVAYSVNWPRNPNRSVRGALGYKDRNIFA